MPKRVRLTPALVALALVIAACGSDNPASAGDTTTTSAPPTTQAEPDPTTTTTLAETTTTAQATTTTTADIPLAPVEAGADADVDAIVAMYAVVFDSTTSFEEKAALITEPDGLESTVETYASTGDSVGGVTATVTAVGIAGSEAKVEYTLEFSGNPTYPNLKGTAVLTDAGWQVSREMFCGIMASARSACPAA